MSRKFHMLRIFFCTSFLSSDSNQNRPIHLALINEHSDLVNLLLTYFGPEIKPDLIYKSGKPTLLHMSVILNNTFLLEIIISHLEILNISIDQINLNLQTGLHIAAAKGKLNMCQILINHGSNAILKDKDGLTPAGLAKMFGHVLTYNYLVVVETCVKLANQVVLLREQMRGNVESQYHLRHIKMKEDCTDSVVGRKLEKIRIEENDASAQSHDRIKSGNTDIASNQIEDRPTKFYHENLLKKKENISNSNSKKLRSDSDHSKNTNNDSAIDNPTCNTNTNETNIVNHSNNFNCDRLNSVNDEIDNFLNETSPTLDLTIEPISHDLSCFDNILHKPVISSTPNRSPSSDQVNNNNKINKIRSKNCSRNENYVESSKITTNLQNNFKIKTSHIFNKKLSFTTPNNTISINPCTMSENTRTNESSCNLSGLPSKYDKIYDLSSLDFRNSNTSTPIIVVQDSSFP